MNLLLKLSRQLRLLLVITLALLAIAITAFRLFTPYVENYKDGIIGIISDQFNMTFEAEHLSAKWQRLKPVIYLQDLVIKQPDAKEPFLIGSVEAEVDLLTSALSQEPLFNSIIIKQCQLNLVQSTEGGWELTNWASNDNFTFIEILNLIAQQTYIKLEDLNITLTFNTGQQVTLNAEKLQIQQQSDLLKIVGIGSVAINKIEKSPLKFILDIDRNQLQNNTFSGNGYITIESLSESGWLSAFLQFESISLSKLSIKNGELWLQWEEGNLIELISQIEIPEAKFDKLLNFTEEQMSVNDFSAYLAWQKHGDNSSSLSIDALTLNWLSENWQFNNWKLVLQTDEQNQIKVFFDKIHLAPIKNALLKADFLPEKIIEALSHLDPKGYLNRGFFSYVWSECIENQFTLLADLENVTTTDWNNIPSGSGINGKIFITPKNGFVNLDSDNFKLTFPNLFNDGWSFAQAEGLVRWSIENGKTNIFSDHITTHNELGQLNGQFKVTVNHGQQSTLLSLLLAVKNSDAKQVLNYLPVKKMQPETSQWLENAIVDGSVNQGIFLYHGEANKPKKIERTIQQFYEVSHANLQYHPEWPQLNHFSGEIFIDDRDAEIVIDKGKILETNLQQAQVIVGVEANSDNPEIKISGELGGDINDGLNVLRNTTLRQNIGEHFEDWRATGKMSVNLDLSMNFKNNKIYYSPKVTLSLVNNTLSVDNLNINLSNLNGVLNYSNEKGLHAKKITGYFLEQPISIDIKNNVNVSQAFDTSVNIEGSVAVATLQQWLKKDVFAKVQGFFSYDAELRLRGKTSYLQVVSDLDKVAISLPYPLGKDKDEKIPLYLLTSIYGNEKNTIVQYGSRINASLVSDQKGLIGGHVHFGESYSQPYQLPGYTITGKLSELDIDQWQNTVGDLLSESGLTVKSQEPPYWQNFLSDKQDERYFIRSLDLYFDALKILGKQHYSVEANLTRQQNHWNIKLKTPQISGNAQWFFANEQPHSVHLDYLFLISEDQENNSILASLAPHQIPPINFSMDAFFYNDEDYGAWSFVTEPFKEKDKFGIRFKNIKSQVKELDIVGELEWYKQGKYYKSYFDSTIRTDDVADVFEAWGYAPSLNSRKLKSTTRVSWLGGPNDFAMDNLQGDLYIKVEDGEFLDTGSRTDVLRVLGILNLNTFARRLRLDFTDLFGKGLSYDKIESKFRIDDGKVNIKEALIIEGPSADMQIVGNVDIIKEELNQEMVVTLPLTSNLPMAAIIAGAPQVGGIIYIVEKVLEKTPLAGAVDQLTSATYRIDGHWDDPNVELMKVFSRKIVAQE